MAPVPLRQLVLPALLVIPPGMLRGADLSGAKVSLNAPHGAASVSVEPVERFQLRVEIDARGETNPLSIRVELPHSGPHAWPVADVEVCDTAGRALLVQRPGIEWWQMLVPLPAGVSCCFIQAVAPPAGWMRPTTERERTIEDNVSGVRLQISRWPDGRFAALSIRFDDSHPTHLTTVVPILREYGFPGTFMINPGESEPGSRRVSNFTRFRADWEALAATGEHELANHSAHHRGASGDAVMEAEIAEAAQAIWRLTPSRSRLTALNLGGGTRWETTRTLRYYLDKYHLFDASGNSTGMDDRYGRRVENFRRTLEQHLARGLWCRIHYHSIGDGLASTEANFRAVLDLARQHAPRLWIAGMAAIYKYETERNAARLTLLDSNDRQLRCLLTCTTDSTLFDQPLTIEATAPAVRRLRTIVVKDSDGTIIPTTPGQATAARTWRFRVPPRAGVYSIDTTP